MTASADEPHVGLVVEGRGDASAVPILLRRWLNSREIYIDVLGRPITCHGRDKALADGGVEGFVAVASARPGCRGVLVVLDAEGDAICRLGPRLRTRAESVSRVPVRVCLADRTFEDWLHSSIETLSIGVTRYQEGVRGATVIKKALRPRKYVKPTWQPRLASRVDFDLACRRSRSLARTLARFDALVALVDADETDDGHSSAPDSGTAEGNA